MAILELELPLPEQKAAVALRRQIMRHLLQHRPAWGTPFFSEQQLMNMTGLSRSTVRRTLSPLEASGWIERRQGLGTFVGPRATAPGHAHAGVVPLTPSKPVRRLLRMTVVTERTVDRAPNPYLDGVLRGMDAAANDDNLSVELISLTNDSLDAFGRRLQRSRPDILAVVGARMTMGFVKGVASMLKIPVIGAGDSAVDMGLPAVSFRDDDAAAQAVQHLLEHGHRRIGLVQQESTNQYMLRRRWGFWQALEQAGLPRDQNMELWLPQWNAVQTRSPADHVVLLKQFLAEQKPTAVIFGEGKLISLLGMLTQSGVVSVPRDLSMIVFDQNYADYSAWLGEVRPTVAALPLEQVGRRLCELAREVVEGRVPAEAWREPCEINLGNSVRSI